MFNAKVWHEGEALAQEYLKKLGYKIIETNAKMAGSEVDIVAKEPKKLVIKRIKADFDAGKLEKSAYISAKKNQTDILVFAEVKARTRQDFGTPEQAVNNHKKQAIKRFATAYIKKHNINNMQIRFDVISVVASNIEHFEDAF